MSTMGCRKDTDNLVREIRAAGGEVINANSGHWKVYLAGHLVTTLATTGSDRRSLMAARSVLRKAGLDLDRQPATTRKQRAARRAARRNTQHTTGKATP